MGLPWTDKGLCGQQLQSRQNNLKTLDSLMPLDSIKHISCYELTVEEGTILDRQLKSGRVQLPDEDVVAAEYEALQQWCSEHGFEQYEVSNFALPGWHSRHNSRYWDRTPYIGVGAGAHSFDGCRRRWNLSDVELYSQSQTAPFEEELLTKEDAFNEYIMTALRTTKGIGKACLEMLFPDNVQYVAINIVKYKQQGLIVETQESYIPTKQGLLRADAIAADLFL
jgi:oxygen-independent coproporphyrinogen-3 oxidase